MPPRETSAAPSQAEIELCQRIKVINSSGNHPSKFREKNGDVFLKLNQEVLLKVASDEKLYILKDRKIARAADKQLRHISGQINSLEEWVEVEGVADGWTQIDRSDFQEVVEIEDFEVVNFPPTDASVASAAPAVTEERNCSIM